MCGRCSSRCPAEIPRFLILLLARRLVGRHVQKPFRHLPKRLQQIAKGNYDAELEALMGMHLETLKVRYHQLQQDKQLI